jgi:preprotein translocase subunit SecA
MTDAIKEESVGYLFSLEVQPAAQAGVAAATPGFGAPPVRQQQQYYAPTAEGDVEVHAGDAQATEAATGNRAQRRATERAQRDA